MYSRRLQLTAEECQSQCGPKKRRTGFASPAGGGKVFPMPEALTRLARCRRCARIFLTHLVSQVGLCLLVVAYAIVGALIFQSIESSKEMRQRQQVSQLRKQCLVEMWNVTEKLNVLHDVEWMAKMGVKLKEFEDRVVFAVRNDGYDGKDANEESLQWSFSGALLYSITVITTIGTTLDSARLFAFARSVCMGTSQSVAARRQIGLVNTVNDILDANITRTYALWFQEVFCSFPT